MAQEGYVKDYFGSRIEDIV